MNELSLFSGAGGGLLGTKLLGWKTLGYVEFNEHCQKVIGQRIKDGILDAAPIFGDIKTFLSEGYAESYKGMVDVVSGGFPCQPFSVAGKQLGEDDQRNMWPATLQCIRTIQPKYAFLENVPGLLSHKYIGRIFGGLAQIGYDAKWCVLGAHDCGANHRRKRLWILANSRQQHKYIFRKGIRNESEGIREDVANTGCMGWKKGPAEQGDDGKRKTPTEFDNSSKALANTTEQGLERSARPGLQRDSDGLTGKSWWSVEPELGRVAHGVANRVDRLKAIGNGQVPIVVKTVWKLLTK